MLDSYKLKEFADDNFRFNKNGRKFPEWVEKLWEKEKLLVTSNFSFSHSVFKRLVLQTRKKHGLFGKGLTSDLKKTCIFRYENISPYLNYDISKTRNL